MERGKEGPLSLPRSASQPHGHGAPSQHLLVNHENRKPLFANPSHATARVSGPRSTTGFEVRHATNPSATKPAGPGPPGLAQRAKSDPPGAVSEMSNGQGGVYVPRKAAFRSPAARRIPGSETRGLQSLRPLSITEAFRIAQEEQQEAERSRLLGGSPSPAPRPWRARPGQPQDEMRARQLLAEDHLDSKARTTRTENEAAMRQNEHRASGAAGLGAAHQVAGRPAGESPKRFGASNPSLQDRINEWRTTSRPVLDPARRGTSPENATAEFGGHGRLPVLVPGIEDVPHPSAEERSPGPDFDMASTPGQDFSWQVEQDFAAGDLQVSDSPRIRVGANSNKPFASRPSILTGTRARSPARVTSPERSNTRIMDIQDDEAKHGVDNTGGNSGLKNLMKLRRERQTLLSRINQDTHAAEGPAAQASTSPDRSLPRPKKNEKLDTIRQMESAGLSKRALAEMRLAEIKEQNAMARPTGSLETPKPSQSQPQPRTQHGGIATRGGIGMSSGRPTLRFDADRGGEGEEEGEEGEGEEEERGEHIPDTPVTIYKNYGRRNNTKHENTRSTWGAGPADIGTDTAVKRNATSESERDLLRRLARAASASPAAPKAAGAAGEALAATTATTTATSKRTVLPVPSSKPATARPSLGAGRFTFTDVGRKAAPPTFTSTTNTKPGTDTDPGANLNLNPNLNRHLNRHLNLDSNTKLAPVSTSFKSSFSSSINHRSNLRSNNGQPAKPTVGFAGLRRANSADSAKSKPSSMQSDADPTAQIEAELKLFAPADNLSERGSFRAPSTGSDSGSESEREQDTEPQRDRDNDDDLADTTPKPSKHDFMSMPTPKITGAYVETPVTAKCVKRKSEDALEGEENEEEEEETMKSFNEKLKEQREREDYDGTKKNHHKLKSLSSLVTAPANMSRDKKTAFAGRLEDEDVALEPPTRRRSSHRGEDTSAAAVAAAPKKKKARLRSQSRSQSRERAPLKNSARLPSVKDDLRELKRQNNMDDSTVEDVEELLAQQGRASLLIKDVLEQASSASSRADGEGDDGVARRLRVLDDEIKREFGADGQKEGRAWTVKEERTKQEERNKKEEEDEKTEEREENEQASKAQLKLGTKAPEAVNPSHTGSTTKPTKAHAHVTPQQNNKKAKNMLVKTEPTHQPLIPDSQPTSVTYLSIPLPYLWRTSPHRRLTWLGHLLIALLIWFAVEKSLCLAYCRPSTCASTPCVYSYDDPTLGYALPVKLDEWMTRGSGRRVLQRVHEDVQDLVADAWDALSQRSIQDIPMEQVPVSRRRQHWRRLRKRGLLRSAFAPDGPEQKAKWDAWRRSRLARERAREERGKGDEDIGIGEEWMAQDERVG